MEKKRETQLGKPSSISDEVRNLWIVCDPIGHPNRRLKKGLFYVCRIDVYTKLGVF